MRKILAGTALTATAFAGMGLTAAAAEAAPKPTPRCQTAGLQVTFKQAPHQVGMNKRGWWLTLKNNTSRTCYVKGYPTLTLQNAKHKKVRTQVRRGDTHFFQDPGARKLVLKPGKTVKANVSYSHIVEKDTVKSSYIVIGVQGAKGQKTLKFKQNVWRGQLRVTAFASKFPMS